MTRHYGELVSFTYLPQGSEVLSPVESKNDWDPSAKHSKLSSLLTNNGTVGDFKKVV